MLANTSGALLSSAFLSFSPACKAAERASPSASGDDELVLEPHACLALLRVKARGSEEAVQALPRSLPAVCGALGDEEKLTGIAQRRDAQLVRASKV